MPADDARSPGQNAGSRRRLARAAIEATLAASATPYGYTIAIWSSGAVLIRSHGSPSVGDVFLFLTGALLAFTLLGLLGRAARSSSETIERRDEQIIAGVLHWIAVGGAVGAAALIAKIHAWVAWPLASFTATCIYLLRAGGQLALVAFSQRRSRKS